jgi:hypothetical protein
MLLISTEIGEVEFPRDERVSETEKSAFLSL